MGSSDRHTTSQATDVHPQSQPILVPSSARLASALADAELLINDSQASGESGNLSDVGRKSREKLRRRQDSLYKAKVEAGQADRRGRAVPPTPEAYERIALRLGSSGIIEALLARHNWRWENVRSTAAILAVPIAETLHVVYPLDVFLWESGVRFTEMPCESGSDWTGNLRWGIDSACQVSRMVLCANIIGAAAIARTQLERWSSNRCTSRGLEQADGTSTSDFYTRIWGGDRPKLSAGDVWMNLSEGLHGRGPLVGAAKWEAIDLAAPSEIDNYQDAIDSAMVATQLSLRQILECIATLAEEANKSPDYIRALRWFPLTLPTPGRARESRATWLLFWPLDFGMISEFDFSWAGRHHYLSDVEAAASGIRIARHEYWERAVEAFSSRRLRAISCAKTAFDSEMRELGDKFDPEALVRRSFGYTIIGETSALLARWLGGPRSDALATASCAVRAAYWLWLEDDDRAMIAVRTIVEQTARLRTWRNKPDKAAVLESRAPITSTRDWLEAAGWRRLSVFNKSLGEFSHVSLNSRWTGAREALSLIQDRDSESSPEPIKTARGNALNEAVFAFGSELYFLVHEYHAPLATAFESVLPYGDEDQPGQRIERWLQRCWDQRSHTFGESDFTTGLSPTVENPEKDEA